MNTARGAFHATASAARATFIATGAARLTRGLRAAGSRAAAAAHEQPDRPSTETAAPSAPANLFIVSATDLSGKAKQRLDAYLSLQLPDASRAKVTASIKAGLVRVNGLPQTKPAYNVKRGESISCQLLPPEPCTAIPEAIPLDVVYEDDHLLVVNKAPGMVVHLSPGHATGTLVNALLAHCRLSALEAPAGGAAGGLLDVAAAAASAAAAAGGSGAGRGGDGGIGSGGGAFAGTDVGLVGAGRGGLLGGGGDADEDADEDDDEYEVGEAEEAQGCSNGVGVALGGGAGGSLQPGVVRPGIVHRLDKGTSGLLVVAKDDVSHWRLCEQFKARTVSRIYHSIIQGQPPSTAGRVATNICRDPGNRLRMMAAALGSSNGKSAASNYRRLEVLAGGSAALVEWRLESGRTHQIRHTPCHPTMPASTLSTSVHPSWATTPMGPGTPHRPGRWPASAAAGWATRGPRSMPLGGLRCTPSPSASPTPSAARPWSFGCRRLPTSRRCWRRCAAGAPRGAGPTTAAAAMSLSTTCGRCTSAKLVQARACVVHAHVSATLVSPALPPAGEWWP